MPSTLPGDELKEAGSGKYVLDTGFGLKVTERAALGRSVSCSSGVLSGFESIAVEDDEALGEAISKS